MKYLEKYTSLNRTLELLKLQVIDSLPFAAEVCPRITRPDVLWYWLKPKLEFQDDEYGYEDLQSMETLFRNHGRGDCDCFVITTLACLIVNGFDDIAIDLAGYNKKNATHIYAEVRYKGERIVLDFTNPRYNMERKEGPKGKYNYRQIIPVKWRNWRL